MKNVFLFLALLLPFTFGCDTQKADCPCDPCVCTDCQCDAKIGAPVDDSHRAYLTVYGAKDDPVYQTFCQWGRQTQGTHYAEISTDMPMADRLPGIEPPRILITASDGTVHYKGAPRTYAEFKAAFNRNCPDGFCRPSPSPAPVPAPAPAPVSPAPVMEPIPDTDDGDSGMPAWWLYLLVAIGALAGGYATWHKQEYYTS
jgi:hypothetical protein